jgi:CMP-N-acetylneuraminic acid synthetase
MKAIAIIPARGGSKRIPRKNIRNFLGKPIIAYSIEAAQKCGLFDNIMVSSEEDEILTIARQYGATGHKRSPELAEIGAPDCGTQEVTRDVLVNYKQFDYACCIYPCAPLMTTIDLARGFAELHKSREAFAYSAKKIISPIPVKGFEKDSYWKKEDTGWFYWGHRWAFIGRVPLQSNSSHVVVENAIDINTEDDWKRAEEMYSKLHGLKI